MPEYVLGRTFKSAQTGIGRQMHLVLLLATHASLSFPQKNNSTPLIFIGWNVKSMSSGIVRYDRRAAGIICVSIAQRKKKSCICAGEGCSVLKTESISAENSNLLNNFQCTKWMECNCPSSFLNGRALLSVQCNELEISHMYFVIRIGTLEAHVFTVKTDHSLIASGKTAYCLE